MSYEIRYVSDPNAIWYQASFEQVLRELGPLVRRRGINRMQYLDQLNAGRAVLTPTATIRRVQR